MSDIPTDTAPASDGESETLLGGSAPLATAAAPADDSFELSLRLLTALVVVALIGSLGLLGYRWIAPRLERGDTSPLTTRLSRPPAPAVETDHSPSHGDEVLMDPGRVFRCVDPTGRVSFSDQACPGTPAAAPAR